MKIFSKILPLIFLPAVLFFAPYYFSLAQNSDYALPEENSDYATPSESENSDYALPEENSDYAVPSDYGQENSDYSLPSGPGQPAPSGPGQPAKANRGIFKLDNPLKAESFEDIVAALARWIYLISIPLASIMILYAGFLFMTSGGNEERIKTAKRTLLWTVVGIVIIIIGSGFISLIKDILQAK
jgi:hypothetical protein